MVAEKKRKTILRDQKKGGGHASPLPCHFPNGKRYNAFAPNGNNRKGGKKPSPKRKGKKRATRSTARRQGQVSACAQFAWGGMETRVTPGDCGSERGREAVHKEENKRKGQTDGHECTTKAGYENLHPMQRQFRATQKEGGESWIRTMNKGRICHKGKYLSLGGEKRRVEDPAQGNE